ncbi:MAG: MarC family NAAT transporter, partial [Saprospiraceae bacterium]|nr:MarC family NAAT transporter [Saprospiraceae bacterium]
MAELFIAVLASLFSVVNPLGAVPVFLSLTPDYTPEERDKTALHTSLYFVLILMSFFFAGTLILSFFGISINAMRIAGGLVILLSGFSLLSGKFEAKRGMDKKVREEALEKDDISFSPMAMPMLSGPGSISLLIGMFSEHQEWSSRFVIAGVLVVTGFLVYLVLRTAPYLYKIMGEGGLKAISRIMGFIVMAIGIQTIIHGVVSLVKTI